MTPVPRKSRSRAALLALLLLVGFACTVVGICLIAFSDSTRTVRLGLPIAFWGVLIGAFALHGTRWTATGVAPVEPGGVLEVRRSGEVEREDDAATRREYELRLELMLRRQMEQVLREQVTLLRQDVAGLRGEVLEAVDGRLRLERIETTRIIGSDLAALQNEVRRLNVDRDPGPLTSPESAPILERAGPMQTVATAGGRSELWTPSSVPPAARPDVTAAPTPVPEPAAASASRSPVAEASAPPAAAVTPASSESAAPEHKEVPVVRTSNPAGAEGEPKPTPHFASDPAAPEGEPKPAPHFASDPFAGLPRLSSFDAEVLTPVEPKPVPKSTHRSAPAPTPAPAGRSKSNGRSGEYVGRRRST